MKTSGFFHFSFSSTNPLLLRSDCIHLCIVKLLKWWLFSNLFWVYVFCRLKLLNGIQKKIYLLWLQKTPRFYFIVSIGKGSGLLLPVPFFYIHPSTCDARARKICKDYFSPRNGWIILIFWHLYLWLADVLVELRANWPYRSFFFCLCELFL